MAHNTEPTKFTTAWGGQADVNVIPDTAEDITGAASVSKLFPIITQLPLPQGGVAPSRVDMNGLLKVLGENIQFKQKGGVYTYDSSITYDKGNIVLYANELYLSTADDNTASPTDTSAWSKLIVKTDTATTSNAGAVTLATSSEATTGTNTTKAVTPAALKSAVTDALGGYVTLATTQTVSGNKTYSGTSAFSGAASFSKSATVPTVSSSDSSTNAASTAWVRSNIFNILTNYGTSEQIISMHNNVFRGDNLLSGHFASISAIISAVAAGNFSDIYVGDYFPATYTVDGSSITSNFRVAGINFFTAANGGWGSSGKPHLVIVPDSTITSYMNSTNTTAGGYVGSYMYTTTLPKLYTALAGSSGTPFYGHIISKYERLSNSVDTNLATNGYSGWVGVTNGVSDYANQTLTLMSEIEMYGHNTWDSCAWDEEHAACQLPLFRVNPNYITVNGTQNTWLRGVTDSASFCAAGATLFASGAGASYVLAVRPRFLIG